MGCATKVTLTCWHGREVTTKPKFPGGYGTALAHKDDDTPCSGKRR